MARCRRSILLYADSGFGKTAQIGEWAEHIYRMEQRITRLYCGDPGGFATIQPHVSVGIIEVVDIVGMPRPWEILDAISKGKVVDPGGRWVLDPARNARVGCYAFEGFTGFGDLLMQDLAKKAAGGVNVGGQNPNVKFTEGTTTVAGNAPSHYGTVQTQLTMAAQESFHLDGADVIWTALARRATDNDTNATILGPQIVGKQLTSEVPRWFNYTFRLNVVPADVLTKAKARHVLHVEDHTDLSMPGAVALGNSRIPMYVGEIDPIEPASLPKAILLLESKGREAESKLRERLGGLPLPNEPAPAVLATPTPTTTRR
jgi:hypothetical protein